MGRFTSWLARPVPYRLPCPNHRAHVVIGLVLSLNHLLNLSHTLSALAFLNTRVGIDDQRKRLSLLLLLSSLFLWSGVKTPTLSVGMNRPDMAMLSRICLITCWRSLTWIALRNEPTSKQPPVPHFQTRVPVQHAICSENSRIYT